MYSISEFSERVNKSIKTLQRWDRLGTLKAKRTLTNRRYYTEEDILHVMGKLVSSSPSEEISSKHLLDELITKIKIIFDNLCCLRTQLFDKESQK